METKLEKEVRFLKAYAVVATLLGAVFVLTAFTLQSGKQKFEEIDVERINVVEKDGKLKMVISNQGRQHPGVRDGKIISRPNGRPPGIIFFNEIGDECGGFVFDGNKNNGQSLGLSFDKFGQSQTIQVLHAEGNDGKYRAGLLVWDRLPPRAQAELTERFYAIDRKMQAGPEKTAAIKALKEAGVFGIERVSVAKGIDQAATIMLSDPKGRARIKISVDVAGTPRLEFLDENGKVTYSLPQERKGAK